MKTSYGHDFYADRHQATLHSARTVLALVLDVLPPVRSAIDFGCGVGTWLSVVKERGADEVRGMDGPWVDQSLLAIPKECFRTINFEDKIVLDRRYDLAITLEVAEHVSPGGADAFVDSLVGASDVVLFSAAIPLQGGVDHVNEQWPEYWIDKFASRGYEALDFLRRQIWGDARIPFWYRQNVLLFVKRERLTGIPALAALHAAGNPPPIAMVHPDLFLSKIARMSSVRGSWRLFQQAARHWVAKRIGGA